METIQKKAVKNIAEIIYSENFHQVTIDFIQDQVEELLRNEHVTPDEIGATCYDLGTLKEVFNPEFKEEIVFLEKLYRAMNNWLNGAEFVNKVLGIDPNK